jgi:hypothetical protein
MRLENLIDIRLRHLWWDAAAHCKGHISRDMASGQLGYSGPKSASKFQYDLDWCLDTDRLHIEQIRLEHYFKEIGGRDGLAGIFNAGWLNPYRDGTFRNRDLVSLNIKNAILSLRVCGYLLDYWVMTNGRITIRRIGDAKSHLSLQYEEVRRIGLVVGSAYTFTPCRFERSRIVGEVIGSFPSERMGKKQIAFVLPNIHETQYPTLLRTCGDRHQEFFLAMVRNARRTN